MITKDHYLGYFVKCSTRALIRHFVILLTLLFSQKNYSQFLAQNSVASCFVSVFSIRWSAMKGSDLFKHCDPDLLNSDFLMIGRVGGQCISFE